MRVAGVGVFVLLLLLLLVGETKADIVCPALFFVIQLTDYQNLGPSQRTVVDYGNYLLRNSSQLPGPFYLPSVLTHEMWERYPCAILISVISDEPHQMKSTIEDWIHTECKRLQRKPLLECFNPTSIEFKLASMEPDPDTQAPTPAPTFAPTIPETCSERVDQKTCLGNGEGKKCHWFGTIIGCETVNYCGLTVREACLSRKQYCRWSPQTGCITKGVN